MNIVVASDDNYAPHLETLIVSIGENNKTIDSIIVYILDGGLSEHSKLSILKLKDKYANLIFKFYLMTEEIIQRKLGGSVSKDRSLSAYARIFIPEIINDNRAIYMDVDAIVMGDLTELYDIDIIDYAIAGVRDTNPIQRHRNVGLDDEQIYINSGMILWNLDKCREIDTVKQCVDFVRSRNGNVDAMDQGTINGVFGKQNLIKPIHPKYNTLTSLFQFDHNEILSFYGLNHYYLDSEIIEARNNPVFVHFTPNMTTRPWVKHCKHPLQNEYWKYRRMTSYSNEILEPDVRKIKLKLLSWGYFHLPFFFFKKLLGLLK